MANIRDVARLANVSPATVSRILNDSKIYKTTDETRERCAEVIRLFAAGKGLPGKRTAGLYDKTLL